MPNTKKIILSLFEKYNLKKVLNKNNKNNKSNINLFICY